ncbi:MAG: LacI family DNA-binding transcriptional regulator [Victivallales bacterium]
MVKGRYIPSMSEIARETGVAISTVSRVLKNDPRISEQTKDKVLESAGRLGYRPNLLIEGIRGEGTHTVGVSIELSDNFHARLINGIINSLWEKGYASILLFPRKGGIGEQDVFKAFLERRVDGVIMRPVNYSATMDYFKNLAERGLPIVMADVDLKSLPIPFSGVDDYAGGRMAAEYLIRLGHKVIAHAPGNASITTGALRKSGFSETLSKHGGIKEILCRLESFIPDPQALKEMLLSKSRPTAVFAGNDNVACEVYKVAMKLGLRIPQDLSVLGFGDLELGRNSIPPLSTFNQDPDLTGRNAVELLFEQLNGKIKKYNNKKTILVKPELIIRGSTTSPYGRRKA